MVSSLEYLQDKILEELQTEFAQPVYLEGIPNGGSLRINDRGRVDPYLTVQFSDPFTGGSRGFVGQKNNDYRFTFAVQVLTPDADIGRRLSNKLFRVLVGKQWEYMLGEISKNPVGGAINTINQSDPALQVYMVPSWFRFTFQYVDEIVI